MAAPAQRRSHGASDVPLPGLAAQPPLLPVVVMGVDASPEPESAGAPASLGGGWWCPASEPASVSASHMFVIVLHLGVGALQSEFVAHGTHDPDAHA